MRRRLAIVTAATVLTACALVPATAAAKIDIYAGEQVTLVGTVKSLTCKLKHGGKLFSADAKTTNGRYKLSVDIYSFDGFKEEYPVPFGVINPTVNVEGVGTSEDYSNNYPFPGVPPPSSGSIAFGKKGKRMGIGIYTLPNSDYSAGLALAGVAPCNYPAKKKGKK